MTDGDTLGYGNSVNYTEPALCFLAADRFVSGLNEPVVFFYDTSNDYNSLGIYGIQLFWDGQGSSDCKSSLTATSVHSDFWNSPRQFSFNININDSCRPNVYDQKIKRLFNSNEVNYSGELYEDVKGLFKSSLQ